MSRNGPSNVSRRARCFWIAGHGLRWVETSRRRDRHGVLRPLCRKVHNISSCIIKRDIDGDNCRAERKLSAQN